MTDVAVITRLANHQAGAIAAEGKLAGHFVADEPRSARDQQLHFFCVERHDLPAPVA
jgi:uncharacterized protein (DUF1800 family)